MRECPNCHYIEPPNWRHPAHMPEVDYVRFDEFQEMLPDLAKKLIPGKFLEDEINVYYISRTKKYVYRVWLPVFKAAQEEGKTAWRQIRAKHFYDAAGRTDRGAYRRLLRIKAQDAAFKKAKPLEKYLGRPGPIAPVLEDQKESSVKVESRK